MPMKIKYINQPPSETNHDEPHAVHSTFTRSPIPSTNLIAERYLRSAVLVGVASLALSLSSCVIPYENYGSNSGSYSGYQNGHQISALPYGYRREILSGNTYYYHDGHYYRRSSNGYVVTDAPHSSRYYEEYEQARQNRYSRSNSYGDRQDRYDRPGDDRRVSVSQLPAGYRIIEYRGQKYYKYGDRYYVREDGRYYAVASPY